MKDSGDNESWQLLRYLKFWILNFEFDNLLLGNRATGPLKGMNTILYNAKYSQ